MVLPTLECGGMNLTELVLRLLVVSDHRLGAANISGQDHGVDLSCTRRPCDLVDEHEGPEWYHTCRGAILKVQVSHFNQAVIRFHNVGLDLGLKARATAYQ